MNDNLKLQQGLEQLKFSNEQIPIFTEKFNKYINEIILFNSAYNLTNTSDYDEIVVNHILDSLSAWKNIDELAKYAAKKSDADLKNINIGDIGSGGGLPGIPLSVVFPQYNFTLVERMDKRCAFLENVIAILGLKNVVVLKTEAEKVKADSFDVTTFRAFRPLDKKIIKTLLNLTKPTGFLAAYKAKKSNITEEMTNIKEIVSEYKIVPLIVPFLQNHERNLVIV